MSNKEQQEARERRAHYAQQLKDNPVYSEIFEVLIIKETKDLIKCNFLQKRKILEHQRTLKTISKFQALLGKYIDDGKLAQKQLARQNK